MRELILFRHAKAAASAEGGDRARPLTEEGRLSARRMGAKLARENVRPDLVLVSSATRTRETWDMARTEFPRTAVEARDDLYDATSAEIDAAVRAVAQRAEVVLVIGHNPGLQSYAVELLSRGGAPARAIARVAAGFPPAMAAVFAMDAADRASLDGLFDPRDLGPE